MGPKILRCSQRCTYHPGISCFVGGLVLLVPVVLKPLGLFTEEFRLCLAKLLLSLPQLLLSIVYLLGFVAQLRVEVEVQLRNSRVAVDFHPDAILQQAPVSLQQLLVLALEPLDFLL